MPHRDGPQRRAAGKLEEAFTCVKELWEQQRDAMSSGGRIETLEQMAELYSVAISAAVSPRL